MLRWPQKWYYSAWTPNFKILNEEICKVYTLNAQNCINNEVRKYYNMDQVVQ